MKKSFSKILVLILTVSMLVSVLSVGISAATPSISLSTGYSSYYYYFPYVTATVTDSSANVDWELVNVPYNIAYISSISADTKTAYIYSLYPLTVEVKATIRGTSISATTSIYVVPNDYYNPSSPWLNYPWVGPGIDLGSGITSSDWWYYYYYYYYLNNGEFPSSSSVVFLDDVAYPWCGNSNVESCTLPYCIHHYLGYLSGYTSVPVGTPESSTTGSTTSQNQNTSQSGSTGSGSTSADQSPPVNQRWRNLYKDVPVNSWAYYYVRFVDMNGYMKGRTTLEFGVNATVTRAEFAEALGKYAEIDISKYASKIEDVSSKSEYAPYVAWAVEKGLMSVTDGKFSPDSIISREEAAVALYNYILSLNVKPKNITSISVFADTDDIGKGNEKAVDWAVSNGILLIGGNNIKPNDDLVKVTLAQMLYNLDIYLG